METLLIELSAKMKSFVEKKVSQGEYESASVLFQRLLAKAMDTEWRMEVEQKLLEALEDEKAGRVIPWSKERFEELLQEHQEYVASKKRSGS